MDRTKVGRGRSPPVITRLVTHHANQADDIGGSLEGLTEREDSTTADYAATIDSCLTD